MVVYLPLLFLILLAIHWTAVSGSTSTKPQPRLRRRALKLIPLEELSDYYFHDNSSNYDAAAKLNSQQDPRVVVLLSTDLLLQLSPLATILDSAAVIVFEESLEAFYDQIFGLQQQYDVRVKDVTMIKQQVVKTYNVDTLQVDATVDVDFRPQPAGQELTNPELQRILTNLMNRFGSHLINHLQGGEDEALWQNLESIVASNTGESSTNDGGASSNWAIIVTTVAYVVIVAVIFAVFCLYRRELGRSKGSFQNLDNKVQPVVTEGSTEIKKPKDSTFIGNRTIRMGDARDMVSSTSSKAAALHLGSPPTTIMSPRDRADVIFRDDEESLPPQLPTVYSRRVIWAPKGKLGVAMDVVDGFPVVYSIKKGSPLEHFLRPMDRIMAIDEVDVYDMSAADVTQLMVSRMDKRRQITFERKMANGD